MNKNIKFFLKNLSQKLWFKPLIFCLLSIAGALLAHLADNSFLVDLVPDIEKSSLEDLQSTISASMLVIAIFAVGSMLSAFSAASGSATPRSFKLIVADDVSQNSLSVYIGAFIFSIVASIALKNGFYGKAGYFTLFILTIAVFGLVIVTFLRWVERISKLGRLGHTIEKVEKATSDAIRDRLKTPLMGGRHVVHRMEKGIPFFSIQTGYIQHINMDKLQHLAEALDVHISLNCLPGTFASPDRPIAYIISGNNNLSKGDSDKLNKAYAINASRSFHDDPRFGLIALSEIGSRALSPGINDPGTAIAVLGSYVRLFYQWFGEGKKEEQENIIYNRIEVPEISIADIFDDAFRPIARDGANNLEVMIRLQKALITISYIGAPDVKEVALLHSRQAFERAELEIKYKRDLDLIRNESLFAKY